MIQHKNNKQYTEVIQHLFHPEATEMKGKTITFQVTDACNLKCSYCYQINKGTHVMDIETAKKFIDLILDNNESTKKYIDSYDASCAVLEFIGGEPFLQIDLIDQICDYWLEALIARNHPWQFRYMISICSNGILYFNPKVQQFLRKHFQHLSFSISIDGNKELHDACRVFPDGQGSYDIAIAGVRHWKEYYGAYMGSKMTLAPGNIQYTFDAVKGLLDEGYCDINLNCVYEKGWTVDHAKILYEQLKLIADYLLDQGIEYIDNHFISIFQKTFFRPKDPNDAQNWCGGNGAMISVDYKGDIYPCIRYMESSLGNDIPPVIIGNVNTGIMATPEQIAMGEMVQNVNRLTQSTQECIDCPIAEGCSWCQGYNYQDSCGDINKRATYICIMHKARALGNAYLWNHYYRLKNEPYRFKIWLPEDECLKIVSQEEYLNLKKLEGEG